MDIKIPTTRKKYFRQMIELLDFMPPFDGLAKREKDLFGLILYYNWYLAASEKMVKHSDRMEELFSTKTKADIRLDMDVSKEGLNNLYCSLRKKGLLTYDSIVKDYLLLPDRSITFHFYEIKEN